MRCEAMKLEGSSAWDRLSALLAGKRGTMPRGVFGNKVVRKVDEDEKGV